MVQHNKKPLRAAVFAVVGGLALSLVASSPLKADSKGQCGVSQETVLQVRGMAAFAKRYVTNAGRIVDPSEVLSAAQREKVLGANDPEVQALFVSLAFRGAPGFPFPPPNPEDLAAEEYWDTGAQPHSNPATNTTAAHHAAPEGELTVNKAIQNYNELNVVPVVEQKTVR